MFFPPPVTLPDNPPMYSVTTKPAIPPKVFVLVIDNDSGLSSSVHTTRAGADLALFAYVSNNWESEMRLCMPLDNAEAVQAYFNRDEGDDRAEIEECEVEGQS